MNKKLKTILSYIGVALLGALTGVGALVGVSSCSQSEKTTTPLKSAATPRKRLITSDYKQIICSDKTYYAVAKGYEASGENSFWSSSISNGVLLDESYSPVNPNHNFMVNGYFTFTNSSYNKDYLFCIFAPAKYTSMGNYVSNNLNVVFFQGLENVYSAPLGYFNRSICAFTFTNLTFADSNIYNQYINYFFTLFDIYELSDNYFNFASQINYYAPYGQDIDSYFVNDADMVSSSSYSLKVILSKQPFISGGYVFDTIRLRYQNAIANTYLDNNGNRQTWGVNGFASYSFTEYVNTATNLVVIVNERIVQPWSDGNSSGYNQTLGSKWVSKNYQSIRFFADISDIQLTSLSTLNNSSFSGGYIVNDNNIGLESAFSLIGQAFSSVTGLLTISVLPGITLGLLLFLPLIAGIIVAIIWVVKR